MRPFYGTRAVKRYFGMSLHQYVWTNWHGRRGH